MAVTSTPRWRASCRTAGVMRMPAGTWTGAGTAGRWIGGGSGAAGAVARAGAGRPRGRAAGAGAVGAARRSALSERPRRSERPARASGAGRGGPGGLDLGDGDIVGDGLALGDQDAGERALERRRDLSVDLVRHDLDDADRRSGRGHRRLSATCRWSPVRRLHRAGAWSPGASDRLLGRSLAGSRWALQGSGRTMIAAGTAGPGAQPRVTSPAAGR